MALIQCKECQASISDLAKTCPHCGAPNIEKCTKDVTEKTPYSAVLRKQFLAGFAILLVAFFFAPLVLDFFAHMFATLGKKEGGYADLAFLAVFVCTVWVICVALNMSLNARRRAMEWANGN